MSFKWQKDIFPMDTLAVTRAIVAHNTEHTVNGCTLRAIHEATCVTLSMEKQAYQMLVDIGGQILNSYPTTIEQDEQLLENGSLTKNHRSALLLRLNEKRIVQSVREMVVVKWREFWQNQIHECVCETEESSATPTQ